MNTNLGRVVYDRKLHAFTEKDVARIMRSIAFEETPEVLAKIFADVLVRILFEASATVEEITIVVKMIIKECMGLIGSAFGIQVFLDSIAEYAADPTDIPATSV